MITTDFQKAQRTDPMRRCHYINPTTADGCEAPPQIGKSFCYIHDPDKREERAEAQRRGGLNRRQPEPLPRIPPNLPYMKLESRAHILLAQEVTMNFVLQGQMDIRVANNIGYLCMGALMTIDSTERAERQAKLDAERAANRAEDKAERKAEKEAKKAEKAEKAAEKAVEIVAQKTATRNIEAQQIQKSPAEAAINGPEQVTEKADEKEPPVAKKATPSAQNEAAQNEAEAAPAVKGFLLRDKYGRRPRFLATTQPPGEDEQRSTDRH